MSGPLVHLAVWSLHIDAERVFRFQSGKLVTKMFQKIQDLIDDKDALVFVLIDEVESLTAARNACRAGTEPSDAIRVVNAVLTQIDQIKR
ncbi:Pachytene checkpoint protein 2 [Saguinus oedipus]|uniref:Pachytene checkpoint protein 2 homolog n=1 Tax=Saguinus oedipus TaxID=9490 RepID=A0ABQ9WAM8_SAGOE|nr:Pachytene checkpoint protein 2 [Saguinus oedipus]